MIITAFMPFRFFAQTPIFFVSPPSLSLSQIHNKHHHHSGLQVQTQHHQHSSPGTAVASSCCTCCTVQPPKLPGSIPTVRRLHAPRSPSMPCLRMRKPGYCSSCPSPCAAPCVATWSFVPAHIQSRSRAPKLLSGCPNLFDFRLEARVCGSLWMHL